MTNYIIIADLHLDEYDGRLGKYLELADCLVDTCKSHNAKEMIIAGDTINKSTTNPRVLHTLDKFIDKFVNNNITVSYLLGQHDWALTNISEDMTNTYLSLFKNINYVGDSFRNIEGLKIYFHNYKRGDSVSFPDCDILIGHVSLGIQDVDQHNIKLGIVGDIHSPFTMGKCISISPPMQIHASQPQQGYAICLSLDNGKYFTERIELPRIFELPIPQRLKQVDSSVLNKESKVEKYIIPESVEEDLDLSNLPKPIDFNFRITRLEIEDYKAIKHRELKFDDKHKVVFLQGPNGCGKTTTLDALYYTFVKKVGLTYGKLEVDLLYNGHEWTISRSKKSKLICDGNELQYKTKADFETLLIENFPFIPMLEFFYVRTYKRFFDCDRIKLFEELFNLKEYDYVCTQAKELSKKYKTNLADAEKQISQIEGWLEAYSDQVLDINIDRDSLQNRLDIMNKSKKEYYSTKGQIYSYNERLNQIIESYKQLRIRHNKKFLEAEKELIQKRESLEYSIKRLNDKIIICPNCGEQINGGNIDELITELNNLIEPELPLSQINSELKDIELKLRYDKEKEDIENKLNVLNNSMNDLKDKFNEDEIDELTSTILNYDKNEKLKENIARGEAKRVEVNRQIIDYNTKINDLEDLINTVDIKNPSSLPVQRLQELVSLIETEDIKFSILSELKNGNSKLDLQTKYHGIDYDDCSSGERCVLDMHLINCISKSLGNLGLIMLDESLATLSEQNYEIAGELLSEFSSSLVLVVSHSINFVKYDRKISLE